MSLWVPPSARDDRENRAWAYGREREVDRELGRQLSHVRDLERRLQDIDPQLSLVLAQPNAQHPDLLPGRWHLIRDNSDRGELPTVIQIAGPNGEYEEPSHAAVDNLLKADLWRGDAKEQRKRIQAYELAQREKVRAAQEEERRHEIAERIRSATETQISLNRSSPWSQNVSGRRGVLRERAA